MGASLSTEMSDARRLHMYSTMRRVVENVLKRF
jgi:hypothetical protein